MNLTEEQLKELSELASLFISKEDIRIALEIPLHNEVEFLEILDDEKDNPIFMAYHSGRLKTEIELRVAIKKAALNGSNPAQTTMNNFRTA